MKCSKCKTEIKKGEKFCPECGHKNLNKLLFIIPGIVVVAVIILLVLLLPKSKSSSKSGGNGKSPTNKKIPTKSVTIKDSETKSIKLQKYSNNIFSMDIPEGWSVSTMGSDIHYGIRVFNPKDSRYQIFVYLKLEPFLKSEAAQNAYKGMYNMSMGDQMYGQFAASTVLPSQSTEGFYKAFMYHVTFMRGTYGSIYYGNVNNHQFPELYNIKVLDSKNPSVSGGGVNEKILRMNFTTYGENDKELTGQGLFSASVMPSQTVKVGNVDVSPVLVYSVMGISSAEDDFTSWEPILMKCLNSLKYSDSFVQATQQNSINQGNAARQINSEIQAAYDSYNKAWSSRQTTYDVNSQKQSDATLSYDRIKDPDTGEIYRAEVGWYDSYNTNRDSYNKSNLQLVTSDNDYLEPISGYIYKN